MPAARCSPTADTRALSIQRWHGSVFNTALAWLSAQIPVSRPRTSSKYNGKGSYWFGGRTPPLTGASDTASRKESLSGTRMAVATPRHPQRRRSLRDEFADTHECLRGLGVHSAVGPNQQIARDGLRRASGQRPASRPPPPPTAPPPTALAGSGFVSNPSRRRAPWFARQTGWRPRPPKRPSLFRSSPGPMAPKWRVARSAGKRPPARGESGQGRNPVASQTPPAEEETGEAKGRGHQGGQGRGDQRGQGKTGHRVKREGAPAARAPAASCPGARDAFRMTIAYPPTREGPSFPRRLLSTSSPRTPRQPSRLTGSLARRRETKGASSRLLLQRRGIHMPHSTFHRGPRPQQAHTSARRAALPRPSSQAAVTGDVRKGSTEPAHLRRRGGPRPRRPATSRVSHRQSPAPALLGHTRSRPCPARGAPTLFPCLLTRVRSTSDRVPPPPTLPVKTCQGSPGWGRCIPGKAPSTLTDERGGGRLTRYVNEAKQRHGTAHHGETASHAARRRAAAGGNGLWDALLAVQLSDVVFGIHAAQLHPGIQHADSRMSSNRLCRADVLQRVPGQPRPGPGQHSRVVRLGQRRAGDTAQPGPAGDSD